MIEKRLIIQFSYLTARSDSRKQNLQSKLSPRVPLMYIENQRRHMVR
jgi:hypothetical protein